MSIGRKSAEAFGVLSLGLMSVVFYAIGAYTPHFVLLGVLYLWVIFQLACRLGILDARVLFFASAAIYSTAGSVDYYLFQDSGGFGEVQNATTLVVSSIFMVVAGALLIARARETKEASRPTIHPLWLTVFAMVSVGLLIGYVALSTNRFGLTTGQIDRAILTSEQGTVAALARSLLVACVFAWTWATLQLGRRYASKLLLVIVVISFVIFDIFYFGDRRIALGMLLGVAYLTLNRSRLLPYFIPAIGFGLLGLIMFGALRGLPHEEWVDILSELEWWVYLTPANLDFGGFPLIATNLFESSTALLSAAPNYLDGMLAAIPSWLYPDRPVPFSVWYVRRYHPEVAAIGGGFASNWIMESYVNLGILGCAAAGLATSGLLNVICSLRSRLASLGSAASIPAFAFVMRFDLTTFLQVFGTTTLVALILGHLAIHKLILRPLRTPTQASIVRGSIAD